MNVHDHGSGEPGEEPAQPRNPEAPEVSPVANWQTADPEPTTVEPRGNADRKLAELVAALVAAGQHEQAMAVLEAVKGTPPRMSAPVVPLRAVKG